MPAVIPFIKANACGNDFIIVDGAIAPVGLSEVTRRICDRHNGVGGDGVEWLFPATDADVRVRLFNADGSEAEISGNGTRCVAASYVAEHGGDTVRIATGAGIKTCSLKGREGERFEFEMEMGKPQHAGARVIKLAVGEVTGMPVSMGNPHFVQFVEEFEAGWQEEAAEIGRHGAFKDGVNVELVRVRDRGHIEIRIFERGVGETQSSGTGSCAAAVAAIASGQADSALRVEAPGGEQTVRWEGEVFLRGPAQLVCRGEFFL